MIVFEKFTVLVGEFVILKNRNPKINFTKFVKLKQKNSKKKLQN